MPILPFTCCPGVKSTTLSTPSVNIHSLLLKGLFSLGCCDHDSLLESHDYRALFFLGRGESQFPLKSPKCGGNIELIMLGTPVTQVVISKKQMALYGASQFHLQLSQLP
jgi:hypothetical protein